MTNALHEMSRHASGWFLKSSQHDLINLFLKYFDCVEILYSAHQEALSSVFGIARGAKVNTSPTGTSIILLLALLYAAWVLEITYSNTDCAVVRLGESSVLLRGLTFANYRWLPR